MLSVTLLPYLGEPSPMFLCILGFLLPKGATKRGQSPQYAELREFLVLMRHTLGVTLLREWLIMPRRVMIWQSDDDIQGDHGQQSDDDIQEGDYIGRLVDDTQSKQFVMAREYYCFSMQVRKGLFNILVFGGGFSNNGLLTCISR
jgi:hypothetical protein